MNPILIDDPALADPDWIKTVDGGDQMVVEPRETFHLAGQEEELAYDPGQPRVPAGSPDGGRWTSGGASAVPAPIGQTPLPAGHVRAYHWTAAANKDSVLENGLTMSTARGASYGEGNAIHFDADPTQWGPANKYSDGTFDLVGSPDKILVEVAIPEDTWLPTGGFETQFTILDDLPPSKILAVHEGWHGRYRYFVSEGLVDDVKAGDFDDMADFDDEYAQAIRKIKEDLAVQVFRFDPNQPRVPAGNPTGGQWTDNPAHAPATPATATPASPEPEPSQTPPPESSDGPPTSPRKSDLRKVVDGSLQEDWYANNYDGDIDDFYAYEAYEEFEDYDGSDTSPMAAVSYYMSHGYETMNGALRTGDELSATDFVAVDTLTASIADAAPTKAPILVHRGVTAGIPDGVAVGQILNDPGFMSTSMDVGDAELFGYGATMMELTLPTGTQAIVGNIGEDEVIVQRGSSIRVDEIIDGATGRILRGTVIQP